ncbi:M48 family metallopeptidase, partial [Escherichia coli]|nr:M48 family metallopeptidase [Escherichia coli]
RWLRQAALDLLSEETAEYAERAGVTVTKVSIGDPRGRWGSCASSGQIRYSWRLLLAPSHVRRSTVAHEVAHRIHMNHSPAFHRVVAELYEG